jgi:hypothetical protein
MRSHGSPQAEFTKVTQCQAIITVRARCGTGLHASEILRLPFIEAGPPEIAAGPPEWSLFKEAQDWTRQPRLLVDSYSRLTLLVDVELGAWLCVRDQEHGAIV